MEKELLSFILEQIVEHPEDINIEQERSDRNLNLKLSVNQDDIGKVIGKGGRVAKSIRVLLNSCASTKYVTLEILG